MTTYNFQSSIYVLDDKNDAFNDIDYRWKLMNYYFNTNKINDDSIDTYGIAYSLIPEYLMAAAYLPFNYKNYDMNFNYLTLQDKMIDDYYERIYTDSVLKDEGGDNITMLKQKLDVKLNNTLKNLNDSRKIYNNINFVPLIVVCCLVWFIIIMFLLKILYYYYYEYYGMIIMIVSIGLLIFGVIWKMIYIMRS